MENLLTIGEFAEATRLSPKALRLYAEHGLLSPTRVDNDSGYRYYRTEQLHVARVIALLRAAGMPLREIRRFLVDPRPALLDEYEERAQREHAGRMEVLAYARQVIEEEPMFEVELRDDAAQRYVSRTSNVKVDALSRFISETIGELVAGGIDGPPFAIFHGPVNETDEGARRGGRATSGRRPRVRSRRVRVHGSRRRAGEVPRDPRRLRRDRPLGEGARA